MRKLFFIFTKIQLSTPYRRSINLLQSALVVVSRTRAKYQQMISKIVKQFRRAEMPRARSHKTQLRPNRVKPCDFIVKQSSVKVFMTCFVTDGKP